MLISLALSLFGQTAFPPMSPARLANFLPESIEQLERWSKSREETYTNPSSSPSGGYFRLQVQTLTRTLESLSGPCEISAAGILLTNDRNTERSEKASCLIEISDYGSCLGRIRRDIDHFSVRQTQSGPHSIRQEYLSPDIKVRSFRDERPGGVLKATFIIRDRYQVFMKYQSQSLPPDHYFLTGAFMESSLSGLAKLPHIRGIGIIPLPEGHRTRSLVPATPLFPETVAGYRSTQPMITFSDHYSGARQVYEDGEAGYLILTLYDFSSNQDAQVSFRNTASMKEEDYAHIGTLSALESPTQKLIGILLEPDQFPGEIEGTFLLPDDQILSLYARNCESAEVLKNALLNWIEP